MWQILTNMLAGRNEFASGGLLLMIIGGISVWLRTIPERTWEWIVSQTTMMITVKDDDAAFSWVKEWFLEQRFLKRIRRVDLDTTVRNERIAMIPSPGKHWFWYDGRPFEVWFSRTENAHERSGRRVESLTFRTIGRKRAFLEYFVEDVVHCHTKRQGVQSYLYVYDDGWDYVEGYSPRGLASVVLQPGEKEHLLEDVAQFRRSKQRYEQLGVPYHRGYLLYGPPGTGKTSLVSALAAHFRLSIYVINLAEFNDRSLMSAVNQVPANSVLLFEDIDCTRGSQSRDGLDLGAGEGGMTPGAKENASANAITFSGLLNVLDGFHAPSGVLFVMTTNHVEKLDPALLRPGRIDYRFFMGKASDRQKVELYRRFFPDASEREARELIDASRSSETMAEFQGLLLALQQGEGRLGQVAASHGILV
ncbi:MAG TPA: AAA family ATPase [Candidatus Sulfotelmatobacter sp.]|nr:AAA family ATPase [Candidatus Sulfotelmatobacter sp.]